ncbi:UNVERIFIED_CONTAM: hypothetical protein K2H54_043800 [Gekko kuhli]
MEGEGPGEGARQSERGGSTAWDSTNVFSQLDPPLFHLQLLDDLGQAIVLSELFSQGQLWKELSLSAPPASQGVCCGEGEGVSHSETPSEGQGMNPISSSSVVAGTDNTLFPLPMRDCLRACIPITVKAIKPPMQFCKERDLEIPPSAWGRGEFSPHPEGLACCLHGRHDPLPFRPPPLVCWVASSSAGGGC